MYNHKKSKIARTLWMGMAVFFLVFCSSPVKKYIRLHLYNQKNIVADNIKGDHCTTYDVKDCLIADRHQQTEINILSFLQHLPDNLHQDVSYLPPSSLSATIFTIYRKADDRYAVSLNDGTRVPIPLYLWVRHLQV